MARIGFIGLGHMGCPMAVNLAKAGHTVSGFDLSDEATSNARSGGVGIASGMAQAVAEAQVVITMLPAGRQVLDTYTGPDGIIARSGDGALLVDCSTIDVDSARTVATEAAGNGRLMVDAPVSGGVAGASAGTLTFMVGGPEAAFAAAKPILEAMGKTIVHAGDAGHGQAAKICNNMILGISMIAVSEAFALGEKLGLDPQKLFDISSNASGQCWSMTNYCPVPGLVPASPANRDYAPGFTAAMMLKDLRLAQQAALGADAVTPLGAQAAQIYDLFVGAGAEGLDFSAIIKFIRGDR